MSNCLWLAALSWAAAAPALGPGQFPRKWAEAQQRHQLLYTDRVRDLQKD